jgi:aminopeptidase-like protein
VRDFSPYGYDERQYGSPGFRLPVGCLMRTPHGEYDEYHTSADDLDFVAPEALADSYRVCREAFRVLEENRTYRNLNPKCEPQLGRRGVYRMTGGSSLPGLENAMLWVLSFSDGSMSLLDIAERAGLPFRVVAEAARTLESVGLLEVAS